jgi:hypothetical protein
LDSFLGGTSFSNNNILLYGRENSVANAVSDGYLVVTNESGSVLNQVRIEDTSSPNSFTTITNAWGLNNGGILAQTASNQYMLLDSNMQIKETFSFNNSGQIRSLIQNSDGTYTALTSSSIDHLDANFNVTSALRLQLTSNGSYSEILGAVSANGNLFLIATDNHGIDSLMKLSGSTAGATIVDTYTITNKGGFVIPTNIAYDNGLVYVNGFNNSNMLVLNPNLGVTGNPSGTYKINTESVSGSLVTTSDPAFPISTVISTGNGVFQTHTDVSLVGVMTGTSYAMNTTGLFTTGSMGSVA